MLKIAIPNKGSLSEAAVEILKEAGYAGRGESKTLNVYDKNNNVEFFFLRPKDIAIYVAGGQLDLGITGRDLALDSCAEVSEVMQLGFGYSTFRYAAPAAESWEPSDLAGKRIATSYPNLVRDDLAQRGIDASVIRLDGAVEISIKLGVADVIADVVSTGRTLRKQGLAVFGPSLCESEAVVVGRKNSAMNEEQRIFLRRIEGILHAQNYLMLDYNIDRGRLEEAKKTTPGISGPTVSPLARDNWVAVRAMVPRIQANQIMDQLASLGAQAILASEIRIARI
ncbi:ATP phosphoribosyltransferase [Corynebacterium pseudotuberculosis]|uniref:ATP phosphoribosyltransferase n=1 Tax=Corynebacterium pseudotuberculosis (strain C231) TaxID=681645 RepID=D9QAE4_CORP2|nr:ATP phosphoribosyltransferase [Corynebacterium pseudotuberculosis]ADK28842.1 ATP phosphoribosyltransferase [Corynebacterium pseudotuberculosis FRC41]ADL10520.1 ATP phosphoribosyltransferase [Corynebacterium pseudotuberculosis C231]ADL20929.1 ATP phosphoribosyltransferase [Corynebacterium pseudotuberculosis 1002]ADO26317.1 ATP phosphoribosyltransferase [Corynebacterium pseudotuberculosis I19]AEK92379.1 ATP phosphoribosyl transferase [Corynebacterium pseudotuberculosis PAT10]